MGTICYANVGRVSSCWGRTRLAEAELKTVCPWLSKTSDKDLMTQWDPTFSLYDNILRKKKRNDNCGDPASWLLIVVAKWSDFLFHSFTPMFWAISGFFQRGEKCKTLTKTEILEKLVNISTLQCEVSAVGRQRPLMWSHRGYYSSFKILQHSFFFLPHLAWCPLPEGTPGSVINTSLLVIPSVVFFVCFLTQRW